MSISDETREKLRQAKLGKPGPWRGKKRPDLQGHTWNKGRVPWNKGLLMRMIQGENHPAWVSGEKSYLSAFKRWYGTHASCVVCGTEDKLGYKMHVHHRDHDRTNNTKENLVALCAKCHWHIHKDSTWPNHV